MPTDKILKFKRGNTTKNNAYTGSDGELTVDRTKKTLVVHDGINAGGSPLATEESVNNVIKELENKVDINENITTQGNLFNGLDQLVKLDSSGKLPAIDGSQLTGVSSGSLVDSGVNAGTYKSVTVNSKGIITAGTNPTTLLGYGITDADTSAQVTTKVNNAVSTAVSGLVNSSPGLLDTLDELANALGDDPNFATTVANNIATKVTKNADIVAGTGTKVTYDAKGLVTGSTTPTTLAGYSIGDAYTKTEVNNSLALKFDNLGSQIALKAPLDSPALTGTPTAPTQTAGDNSTKLATTAYVDGKFIRGTAVASTSGTSIDFVGIPSWAKRITIMLNGVSTSGTSFVQLQVGYTTISTSGYLSSSCLVYGSNQTLTASATSGFVIAMSSSVDLRTGSLVLNNISGNGYILSGSVGSVTTVSTSNGYVSLSGVLDRVRITTANGTDTFDAGQINIMYEG